MPIGFIKLTFLSVWRELNLIAVDSIINLIHLECYKFNKFEWHFIEKKNVTIWFFFLFFTGARIKKRKSFLTIINLLGFEDINSNQKCK